MKHVLIERADGGFSLMQLPEDENPLPHVFAWQTLHGPCVRADLVELDTLPSQDFQEAWVRTETGMGVDLVRARALQLSKLKSARDQLLDFVRKEQAAAEDRDDKPAIKVFRLRRQVLAGLDTYLPGQLDQLDTLEKLAAYVPPEFTA